METNDSTVEPAEREELDIEIFAKEHPDRTKPDAGVYIIRIDRERKRVREPELTGIKILALVGKTPDTHKLFQKFCGGETEVIEPDDVVSVLKPGVERFQTIPKDTTDGTSGG